MVGELEDQLMGMAGQAVDFGNGRASRIYDRQGRLSHYCILTGSYAPTSPDGASPFRAGLLNPQSPSMGEATGRSVAN
jgi:hypothetical protein